MKIAKIALATVAASLFAASCCPNAPAPAPAPAKVAASAK